MILCCLKQVELWARAARYCLCEVGCVVSGDRGLVIEEKRGCCEGKEKEGGWR